MGAVSKKLDFSPIESESVSCSVASDSLPPPWTVARQDPLSLEFSRQECWNGLPFPSLGDLPDPGIKQVSPALQVDSLSAELPGKIKCKNEEPY